MQIHAQLRSTIISIGFGNQVISRDPFKNLQRIDPTIILLVLKTMGYFHYDKNHSQRVLKLL